jgi:iron(III) transport system permease protein
LAVVLLSVSGNWYKTPLPTSYTPAHYQAALAHAQVVPGILNSIFFSSAATVLALGVGFMVAWTSVRWRPPFWQVLDTAAMLPLAIPGIILAFGYLAIATRFEVLRTFLDPRVNPTGLLIIAYAVRRLPYVVRAAASGLSTASVTLEEAAAASGAGFLTRLRRVTLPLMAGSLAAGAILTFSFSMLEVSDSLVLAQKRDFWPITRVIYDLVNILGPGPSIACAFATWAMLFLGASLAAAAALGGKSLSSLLRD